MVHSVVFINDTSLSFDDFKDFNIVIHSEFLGFMNSCNTGHKHEASIDVQRCYFILNNHGEWHGEWRWNKNRL